MVRIILWCAQFPRARDAHIVNNDDDNNNYYDGDGEDDNNQNTKLFGKQCILILLYIYIIFCSHHLPPSPFIYHRPCLYIIYTHILKRQRLYLILY